MPGSRRSWWSVALETVGVMVVYFAIQAVVLYALAGILNLSAGFWLLLAGGAPFLLLVVEASPLVIVPFALYFLGVMMFDPAHPSASWAAWWMHLGRGVLIAVVVLGAAQLLMWALGVSNTWFTPQAWWWLPTTMMAVAATLVRAFSGLLRQRSARSVALSQSG